MGQISVSIIKRCAFRDAVQHFSNVYTYGSLEPNSAAYLEADVIIDEIVAMEKQIHSNAVTFEHARMWSSGGTIAENQMLYEKALTGTGTPTNNGDVDRERALLCQWPAGVDSRGRPVYLRKWYHPMTLNLAGSAIPSGAVGNTTVLPTAFRNAVAAIVGGINSVGVASLWGLIAESGRERDSFANPTVHPYFEHHQFGDEWRG
jgi:hypothetical protein